MLPTIAWLNNTVKLIDQRLLPTREKYLTCRTVEEVAKAIETMAIRGAPAIGVAAAYGTALGARTIKAASWPAFSKKLEAVTARLAKTRPTAVNLFWALNRMTACMKRCEPEWRTAPEALLAEARQIEREDLEMNRQLSKYGATLIPQNGQVITYCNTGGLATAGVGTALGALKEAHDQGKRLHVFACETRPVLQGMRLTAWELARARIPFTLISDNMAGSLMRQGRVNCVIVGADRITANGDAANKIGTYSLAVLAQYHGIPFYVAASTSTIDHAMPSGHHIVIEERPADELFKFYLPQYRPRRVAVHNPSFDVTPHDLITGIVTEAGVHRPPYNFSSQKPESRSQNKGNSPDS